MFNETDTDLNKEFKEFLGRDNNVIETMKDANVKVKGFAISTGRL